MEGLPKGGIFRQQWLILGAQGSLGLLKLNHMYKCLVILHTRSPGYSHKVWGEKSWDIMLVYHFLSSYTLSFVIIGQSPGYERVANDTTSVFILTFWARSL